MTDLDWKEQKKIRVVMPERMAVDFSGWLEMEISSNPLDKGFNQWRRSLQKQIKEQRGISDD